VRDTGAVRGEGASDALRVAAVVACVLLAAITPFIVGAAGVVLAIVPLGFAVWLIVRSHWPAVTQVVVTVAVLALTAGLVVLFLILATAYSS